MSCDEQNSIEPSPCPKCGKKLDAATSISDPAKRPKPGDISLCLYCGEILSFGDDLKQREMTEMERFRLEIHPEIYPKVLRAQQMIRARARVAPGGTKTA